MSSSSSHFVSYPKAVVAVFKSRLLHRVDSMLARISSSAIIIQQYASSSSSSLDDDIGVSPSVLKFKDTLLCLKDTLLPFDYTIDSYYRLPEWMRKIKQVLDDAENMLDDIHHSHSSESLPRKQVHKLINKVGHFFSSFSSSHATFFARQINDITHRLQDLVSLIETNDALYAYGMYSSHLYEFLLDESVVTEEESDVVIGRETDKEIIIEKLLMMHQSILPIVGMKGLGKTTLAKIVFRDKRIRESFSMCIWVCDIPPLDDMEVTVQIINSASSFDATCQLTTKHLQHHLENIVVGKKFLLVLDNVQEEHEHYPVKWDKLRNLIQISANESKILLTTCIRSMASMIGTIPSHNLEPLSLNDSLSLFEKLTSKVEAYKYPELIEFGKEFVNRSGAIPLAIKVIGNMLFSQNTMVTWEFMRDNAFRDMPRDYGILAATRLSYYYLSFHLKKCFELFSLYPNDFVFHRNSFALGSTRSPSFTKHR